MNSLVYVDIDRGIHKVKLKNALNEKRKKLRGFSFSIIMANFEAFRRNKNLNSNLFFLKSVALMGSVFLKCCTLIIMQLLDIKNTMTTTQFLFFLALGQTLAKSLGSRIIKRQRTLIFLTFI